MKKLLCTSSLLLISEVLAADAFVPQQSVLQYIATYSPIAMEEMRLHAVPASITLAQGILESGVGASELAREANNHFGIKCVDWTGARYYHDDDAKGECFRKYESAEASYDDHIAFLTTRQRYADLFKLSVTDYKGWAYGLKNAGYATAADYPERLIRLIENYQLYRYDTEATSQSKNTYLTDEKPDNVPQRTGTSTGKVVYTYVKKDSVNAQKKTTRGKLIGRSKRTTGSVTTAPANTQKSQQTEPSGSAKTTEKTTPEAPKESVEPQTIVVTDAEKTTSQNVGFGQVSAFAEHEVHALNGTKYILAVQGDTYRSVAEEFALKPDEVRSINDASAGYEPVVGERIYIRAKKTASSKAFHLVREGETLRDIAQLYGVRLSAVLKRNNLAPDATPLVGQRILLR